jgi:formylglycine-generating enzyme required for sulfatase activity
VADKIFINYRRGDEPGFTQALLGRLEQSFPAEQLFIDVDNIPPGEDFVHVLESQVVQCDALLAVIGKGWLDATDEHGGRRLDDPNDFVRIEIESALRQGKRVIPVLVGAAHMPRPEELPESIRPLARCNAVRLTHERFRADVQGLVKALQRELEETAALHPETIGAVTRKPELRKPLRLPRRALLMAAVLGVVLVGSIGVWVADIYRPPVSPVPTPVQSPPTATPSPALVTAAPAPAPVAPTPPVVAPAQPAVTPASVVVTALSAERERALKPKDTFKECDKCPEMVVVPAGSFTMGSPANEPERVNWEGPQHKVTFASQFAVGKFAVTFDEWDACVADGGCHGYRPNDMGLGRGRRPVTNVSWIDAEGFVAKDGYVDWLSKKTGKTYRLLSEAEREHVTRAGSTTIYYFGNDAAALGQYAWYSANSGNQTHPVGEKKPNAFGLYDMHGNVLEWVEDCYHDSYQGAPTDGSPWTTKYCGSAITRNGDARSGPISLRSARRSSESIDKRYEELGFRVGRTLEH